MCLAVMKRIEELTHYDGKVRFTVVSMNSWKRIHCQWIRTDVSDRWLALADISNNEDFIFGEVNTSCKLNDLVNAK